jgi:hypothetical protein
LEQPSPATCNRISVCWGFPLVRIPNSSRSPGRLGCLRFSRPTSEVDLQSLHFPGKSQCVGPTK